MKILNNIIISTSLIVGSASSMAGMLVMSGKTLSDMAFVAVTLPDGGSLSLDALFSEAGMAQASDTIVYDTIKGSTTVLENVKPSMVIDDELHLDNIDLYLDIFIYDNNSGIFSRSYTRTSFAASTLQNALTYVDLPEFSLRSVVDYAAMPMDSTTVNNTPNTKHSNDSGQIEIVFLLSLLLVYLNRLIRII